MNLFTFYEKNAIFLFFRFNFPTVPIFFPRYWIFFRGLKFFLRCPIYALWVRTIIWMKFSIQKEKKNFFLNIHQKSLKIRKLGLEPRPNFWEFFPRTNFFLKITYWTCPESFGWFRDRVVQILVLSWFVLELPWEQQKSGKMNMKPICNQDNGHR